MATFYLRKIRYGEMTLEEVPSLWRKKVEAKLNEEA